MPRRSRPVKRVIAPDPVYQSEAIAKFVNVVMSKGKRSTAERVVYDALSRASKQAKKEPLEVFESALRNATPLLEVKPRRVGGGPSQVPGPGRARPGAPARPRAPRDRAFRPPAGREEHVREARVRDP